MTSEDPKTPVVYTFDGFRFDANDRSVQTPHGTKHQLKAKAFETLLYLVENPGRVIERDELMAAVWPETVVEENNLTQHISSLRRMFAEAPGDHRIIETVPGRGYKFAAEVAAADPRNEESPAAQESANEPASRKWLAILAAGVVVSLLLLGFLYRRETSSATGSIRSIGVLPCKPITLQNRDESLESGMTNELISKLSFADGLRVSPFSAVRRFDALDQDAVSAGRELGVEAVLECSVQIADGQVRVSARLSNVPDGKQIWAQQFQRELTGIFAVQDEIAERVANSLRVRLSEVAKRRYTENAEAYRLYLKGRTLHRTLAPEDIKRGISYFEQAIEIDPNYALAYAGIADCYRSLILSAELTPSETIRQSTAAARKAVEIDPGLAEAQVALGLSQYWFEHNWQDAEATLTRAIAIDPGSTDAHIIYAHLLSTTGRHDEALGEAEQARKLDPYEPYLHAIQGLVLIDAGKYNEALAGPIETSRVWIAPLFAATAYIDLQRYDEAIAAARRAGTLNPGQTNSLAYESFALARLGRRDEARKILDILLKRSAERYVPPYHIAVVYAGLGERENALNFLEKAFAGPDPKMVFLKSHHFWDDLRSEPRFVELMRKMKLE
jgi:DNA-binding winged helix-turn-helix (wHTH) protein/TolB-like protein/Tfp pilus assembly protein PilF